MGSGMIRLLAPSFIILAVLATPAAPEETTVDLELVIAVDVRVSLANVELLTIRIRLLVCSVDKAEQIGLNWWKYDPHLTMQAPVVPALAEKAPPSPRRASGPKATRVRRPR